MKLVVSSAAQQLGIRAPAACVFLNVAIHSQGFPLYRREVAELVESIRSPDCPILATQEFAGFRKLFCDMGYHDAVPAGARLVNGYRERGFKSFNNLVDAYNIVSARHGVGLGLHDARQVRTEIRVDRASGSEELVPLFQDKAKRIPAGDLTYMTGGRPMAWLGKRDVDADAFKVTDRTQSVVLIVLGNSATSRAYNERICTEVYHTLLKTSSEAEMYSLPVVLEPMETVHAAA